MEHGVASRLSHINTKDRIGEWFIRYQGICTYYVTHTFKKYIYVCFWQIEHQSGMVVKPACVQLNRETKISSQGRK